jgi:hypothetical protein
MENYDIRYDDKYGQLFNSRSSTPFQTATRTPHIAPYVLATESPVPSIHRAIGRIDRT